LSISSYLNAFLITFIVALLLTRWVRNFAVARGWVDAPELSRRVHTYPVPRLGGVAIFLSFMIVVLAALFVPSWVGPPFPLSARTTLSILGPSVVVFLLGLYDDLRSVSPWGKFGIQALAGVLLYFGGIGIRQLGPFSNGHVLHTAIGLSLTVLWVLLITNAFNLIDGLDGLAAGSAFFSTIVVFVISLLVPNPMLTFLTIALAGATLGFLRFNFHPASIFLGDSGSLFIGFMLSALALAGSQKAPTMVAVAIPVVSFGLPILDVVLAVFRRFLGGKPLFSGDAEHIHHKLLKRGLSQREAVLALYAVSAGFGLLSLSLIHGREAIALVLTVLGIGVSLGLQHLRYDEFSELQDLVRKTIQRKHIIANNLNVRRATESLNSCEDLPMICQVLKDAMQPIGFDGIHFRNTATDGRECFLAPLQGHPEGGVRYSWIDQQVSEPAWELKLELITSSGYKYGYCSLLRSCAEGLLLVDLNLFTAEFRTALSDALHRATMRAQPAARNLENEDTPLVAKATSVFSLS